MPARTAEPQEETNNKPNGVRLKMARAPPSPTKKEEKPRPADQGELKDYQLGDCLGKGAFGSVYRALNWGTGETVAIKQIKLADLPKTELRVIMLEIDLLKNLDHPNIVKYQGFVRTAETLNIILEYCENGSLHSIAKNFGRFPENLVALYMSQVLHGLLYLHEQGVIHRDIKGANILTTKQGLVKLADFGVASKTAGLNEVSVVGTPYWMAPEVIELTGATTASDIWSLGCTVIELLDGRPPYHQLQPMPALFRIVNDDHPPLPQGASFLCTGRVGLPDVLVGLESRAGIGLSPEACEFFRTPPPFGESFRASFHSCTLLTASVYSVAFLETTASDLLALTIQGCFNNFRADTRRLGSFWKHCMRKSITTGEAP